VQLLAKCYWKDEHIQPQHWILHHPNYLLLKNLGIPAERLSVYKMDQADDMEAFAQATGFDFSNRANSTGKIKTPEKISSESLQTINHIYQQDFVDFDYKMRVT
jgi:hypothetical protein